MAVNVGVDGSVDPPGSLPAVDPQWTEAQDVGPRQQTDRAQAHIATTEAHTVDLDGIVTVTARAIEVFGTREKAIRWLRTPLPSLSDRAPLSMLNTADGIGHIEEVLGRIEQGIW